MYIALALVLTTFGLVFLSDDDDEDEAKATEDAVPSTTMK